MSNLTKFITNKFHNQRSTIFLDELKPKKTDKILDLGGGDGSFFNMVLKNKKSKMLRENITIADYDANVLKIAKQKFGFKTLQIDANLKLPFKNKSYDIVFSNSLIEHVTGDKKLIMSFNLERFRKSSHKFQYNIASEINRIGKRYFVQTPNKYFPIDSHTLLPFVIIYLPRRIQIILNKVINQLHIREISADWNLLSKNDLAKMFPEALIYEEKFLGLTKSLVVIKK